MIEQVILFGSSSELTGILTKSDSQNSSATAVCLLNSGFIHRTGFNRFNTDLARKLSECGLTSLRFDLHGLGDSARFDGKRDYNEQASIDIGEAVTTVLDKSGAKKCILVGLCSGADFAHVVAVADPRVCGVVFLDGYAYPTLRFRFNDYKPALMKPWKVINYFFKRLSKFQKQRTISATLNSTATEDTSYVREFPPRAKIAKEVCTLVDRGVVLYYVYSGGIPIYYNYGDQFRDMFRSINFKGKVSYDFVKDADHTYTLVVLRRKLEEMVVNWIVKHF
jgi:pimeloyl-ACP methyl ester carboxylesterase